MPCWGGSRGGSGGSVEPPKLNVKTYKKHANKKSEPTLLIDILVGELYFFVSLYAKTAIKTRQICA